MVKRIFLIAAVLAAGVVCAQERELNPLNTHSGRDCETRVVIRSDSYWRGEMDRNYLNVGYVFQTSFDRAFNDGPPLTANTKKGGGVSVVYGTSYILHRQPVLGRLHFGLDATWVDVNYVKGQTIRLNGGKGRTHQLDLAMGVGPAVHIDAGGDWTVEAHLRYNPTLATYYNQEEPAENFRLGYASMWTGGASASWRRWSLGAEVRFGRGRYRTLDWDKYDVIYSAGGRPDGTRSAGLGSGSGSVSAAGFSAGGAVAQHPGGVDTGSGSGSGASYIYGTTDDRVMKLRTIGARVTVGLRW